MMSDVSTLLAGRYRLAGKLASGGMAVVYRATDEVLGRQVAIKVMHPGLANDTGFAERFRREALSAAKLSHANIAMVHDWGSSDETAFMVMELVDGSSLREWMRAGPMSPDDIRHFVAQIASALDHAHERGLIHRDVKPENVLVTPNAFVKVVDFGVARALGEARLTGPGAIGTAAYVAPEQLTSSETDQRADIYALGIMTFEMLTGRLPFSGDTPPAMAGARLSGNFPSTGTGFDPALRKATMLHPADRFASAGEFSGALGSYTRIDRALGLRAPADLPMTTMVMPKPVRRRMRRHRGRWPLAAGLAVLIALAAIFQPWAVGVPSVAGLSVEQARAEMSKAGLSGSQTREVFDASIADGKVISVDPPRTRAIRWSRVGLLISKGPEMLTVPILVGKSIGDARRIVADAGFKLSEAPSEFHPSIPVGSVISQQPPEGRAPKDSVLKVVVSKGPDLVEVPSVASKTVAQAQESLTSAGFAVNRTQDFSDEVAEGAVVTTRPGAGEKALRGSAVALVISRGPKPFPMPSFVGMSLEAAREKAKSLGLVVANAYTVPGSSKPSGEVQGQNPPAKTDVRRGTRIDLYYAA